MTNATGLIRRYTPGPTVDRTAVRHFVYRLHDAAGAPVYIGRSVDVAARIRAHHDAGKAWLLDVRSVSMIGPMTWDEAVATERQEIAAFQPRGNIALTARDHRPMVAMRSAANARPRA